MKANKNIGLITGNPQENILKLSLAGKNNGYTVKKIFITDQTASKYAKITYPNGELVNNSGSLLDDDAIDLIVVAGKPHQHLNIVSRALQAGKHVRFI